MIFWRILDNKVYPVEETDTLGFEQSEGLRIPDEYLEKQEFTVMRTAHGIGDWGIISAMPRLLKEKYPNCKVYIPTTKFLEDLFIEHFDNWNPWNSKFENAENIFKHNPYVDGFKDFVSGEIFHDHYRIYDKNNLDMPLIEQMLKFWQFSEDEYKDSQPEIYWSDKEKELGDSIIKEYVGTNDFGCLLISDRYDYTMDKLIKDKIDESIPHFYWTERPIEQTEFDYINKVLDMRNVDVRIQLYIKSKAKYNVGNQCGTSQIVSRYSDVYSVQRQFPIAHNLVRGENLLDDEVKRKILLGSIRKSESKTTTSMKFKADIVDFYDDDFKDKTIVEVGTSLGFGTKIISPLFKKVITLDSSPEKIQYAKDYLKDFDNIEFKLMDVYNQMWKFEENADVVFIDCVHDYNHVKSDVDNSINTFDKPIIMFDDYGLFPEVKRLVDEYITDGKLKVLKKIGQYSGKVYPKTQNKVLIDSEGLICQTL